MWFKERLVEGNYDDIVDCFNALKYISYTGWKISISSILPEKYDRRVSFSHEKKFRKIVSKTVVLDKLTNSQLKTLHELRKRINIPKEAASRIWAEEYFRWIISKTLGKRKEREKRVLELKTLRDRLKIPQETACRIYSEERLRKAIEVVLRKNLFSNSIKIQLITLQEKLKIPQKIANEIFLEEKLRVYDA